VADARHGHLDARPRGAALAPVALITGASGLIGRHVVQQWNVDGLQAEALDHARDDLLEPGVPTALVERVRPAVVVHLAWIASGSPDYRSSPDNERWLRSSLELARACAAEGALLLATGTPLDGALESPDAYSSAKAQLWHELRPAVDEGRVGWLRPYYVFDEERRRPALLAHALAAREQGAPVVLRTPESEHDFIHAADVGRAVVLAAQHRLAGELPIGSGRVRRVCDLVTALGIAWTTVESAVDGARPQLHDVADSHRLRDVGWAPRRTDALFAGS
jgi:nucleoside-diphosphate-sugar epimerase